MSDDDVKRLLAEATPGPWSQFIDQESGCSDIMPAMRDGTIAIVTGPDNEIEANAALIAAAPTIAAAYIEQAATIANAMIECSLATGHGDTVADLAAQIPPQVAELRATLARLTDERDRLREALAGVDLFFKRPDEDYTECFERIADIFLKETGYLRPGKSEPAAMYYDGRDKERQDAWDKWVDDKLASSRAALGKEG